MLENLIVVDKAGLEKKKRKIREEGAGRLHVISDFDKTLTKAFVNGEKVLSLISYLRNGKYLTSDYAEKAHRLFSKYHPIEISSDVSDEEKIEKMEEWWRAHFELLVESGLDRETIKKATEEMTRDEDILFRKGSLEFIDFLYEKNVPMMIISSSIGDMIEGLLRLQGRLYDNVHIIANTLKFDKNGKFAGIKDKIIHSMNKKEILLRGLPVYSIVEKRKNVLLLGDSIGDLGMVEGFPYDNIIKIGFLNEEIEARLEEYKKKFDVVITNDHDMNYVNELIKQIL